MQENYIPRIDASTASTGGHAIGLTATQQMGTHQVPMCQHKTIYAALPDQVVGHLVLGIGIRVFACRRIRVHLQCHRWREYRFGFGQYLGSHQ